MYLCFKGDQNEEELREARGEAVGKANVSSSDTPSLPPLYLPSSVKPPTLRTT